MAALLLASLGQAAAPTAASAIARGRATGSPSVTSATWAVTPTTTATGTPTPGSVSLSYGIVSLGTPPPQYFYVANSGTRTLARTTYTVVVSGFSLPSLPNVVLSACDPAVTWNTTTGSCNSGSPTTIGTFNGTTSTLDSPTAPTTAGIRLHVQASVSNIVISGTLSAVISTQVSSNKSPADFAKATTNG